MKRFILFFLIGVSTACSDGAVEPDAVPATSLKKVLFVGNSYTAGNNLPELVKQIALSVNDQLEYDKHTPGGATLMDHANNNTLAQKINSKKWDFVTVQAQSQEVWLPDWYVNTNVFPYAKELSNKIRKSNSKGIPLFFMTWGRKNGDQANCGGNPNCTYEAMDDRLKLNYLKMAGDNKAQVAPVGAVWRHIRENNPSINLYKNDGSHPSKAGSYAAACTFYTLIFEKDPALTSFDYSIPNDVEQIIRSVTKAVVYDDLDSWRFN